jgi:hypothetical protein
MTKLAKQLKKMQKDLHTTAKFYIINHGNKLCCKLRISIVIKQMLKKCKGCNDVNHLLNVHKIWYVIQFLSYIVV